MVTQDWAEGMGESQLGYIRRNGTVKEHRRRYGDWRLMCEPGQKKLHQH
jgi:hypothetical protein